MPEMGESVTEGTVLEWHVVRGRPVDEGDTVIEVSTDKVDAEVPAPAAARSPSCWSSADDTVQVGQALAEMAAGGTGNGASAAATAPAEHASTETETPPARRPTRRQGNGEGLAGRPPDRRRQGRRPRRGQRLRPGRQGGQGDVLAAADGNGAALRPPRPPPARQAAARPGGDARQGDGRESRSVPTATSFRTLPVDTLDAKRKAINGALKERGMKVSFTHLIAWAIVQRGDRVAGDGPQLRGGDGKPQVVEAPAVNLGIAVDVERKDGRAA